MTRSRLTFDEIGLREWVLDKFAIRLHHSRSKFCIAWILATNQPNRVLTDPVGFLVFGLVLFVSVSLNSYW